MRTLALVVLAIIAIVALLLVYLGVQIFPVDAMYRLAAGASILFVIVLLATKKNVTSHDGP